MVSASVLALDVEKLNLDWDWMLSVLRSVLEESGDGALANLLPDSSDNLDVCTVLADSVQLTQAYSIAFQLLGMAEQISAARFRNQIEQEKGVDQLPALWGDALRELKASGISEKQIADQLSTIQVELVLTAHPTEAKRATVLAHHRRLFDRFVARHRGDLTTWQKSENETAVRSLLGILWRTGEIYLDKPDLQSERRNVIDYLTHVFPAAIKPLDLRLRQAWEHVGFDPQAIRDPLSLPKLTFGTWVGGDRDGHPLVTPQVTAETLMELRRSALGLIQRELTELARLLSLSAYWVAPRGEFLQEIAKRVDSLGDGGSKATMRNPNEPWRQFINLMLARLPKVSAKADAGLRVDGEDFRPLALDDRFYRSSEELLCDLRVLYDALVSVSMRETADFAVRPLMRIVQAFGFHLAVLDIRQNSAMHDKAIEQLLAAGGFEDSDYSRWDESKRVAFLEHELKSQRPFLVAGRSAGKEADAVLGALNVIRQYLHAFGAEGLGSLIVSMTRQPSDLLGVYLLAREVGLLIDTDQGTVCPLQVVPLFETIDDLHRSPEIYDCFLSCSLTRRSMEYLQHTPGAFKTAGRPMTGQIMIGYSDSNKDGGILASLVGLRHAQDQLAEVGRKHCVHVRFFHGRGGTISRGAGPTHRFIRSLPDRTLQGDLRLTEQGETIAQKYAHQPTAIYNLELFLAGVTTKTLADLHVQQSAHPLEPTLVSLASWAQGEYHDLLHSNGFLDFFCQATPIDAIEQSRIGSRPSRRTGQQSLADLRAIPWVFSWGQARFYLSGWYGVGSALQRLKSEQQDIYAQLPNQLGQWAPLRYLISNVATSVAAVDGEVIGEYAALVEDEKIRKLFLDRIIQEWDLTKRHVEHIYGGCLDAKRPNVRRMIQLRSQGLRILHNQQIGLLRRWRSYHRMGEATQADSLLPQLLLTVNAIASGLGATG